MMTESLQDPIALALALMREPSVTPDAAGCFDLLESWLKPLGFNIIRVTLEGDGGEPTENFYARLGTDAPNLCFAGHVDVVPPGDLEAWEIPPFEPTVKDGILYGRGAEDMKAAIAAMVSSVAAYLKQTPSPSGSISFLITADEEGNGINGSKKFLKYITDKEEKIDFCLVGEPTNVSVLGDMAKIGRRGSLVCAITTHGKQGHVAYPHLADNPITTLVNKLHRLQSTEIDDGSEYFPPSNLEVTTVDVDNPSGNSIPASAYAAFNIRFNEQHTGMSIQEWVRLHCDAISDRYTLEMRVSGEAFLTPPGILSEALVSAVESITGMTPELSTTGGTSDARFIKDYCPVIEFGTTGLTPHQVNECVAVDTVEQLAKVYQTFLEIFFNETNH